MSENDPTEETEDASNHVKNDSQTIAIVGSERSKNCDFDENESPVNCHPVERSIGAINNITNTFERLRMSDASTSTVGTTVGARLAGCPTNMALAASLSKNQNLPSNHASQNNDFSDTSEVEPSSRSMRSNSATYPQFSSIPSTSNTMSRNFNSQNSPIYNWQATKSTVRERFAFMFNNETLSDVHFIVGRETQQQRIPAHKFVLAVGSAVFDAMFNGTLATKLDEVELPDVEPAAFLALLKFLYSDDVSIDPETVMTTLYTAKKYAVPALEKHCVDFLKSNLSSDNAVLLLTQARLFDEPQLAQLCLEMIDKNTGIALAADGFTDVDLDTLSAVLERDTLRISETRLFQAVVRWSEIECSRQQLPRTPDNQRSVLGRALNLVRFPLMSIEEFASGPAQSGLLSDRELVQLFLYFTVNPKPSVGFLDLPRCSMSGKEQSINRFKQVESRWGYSGTSDRIRLIVDRKIFIVGFGLYGSIHCPAEYEVTIQLIQTANDKVMGRTNTIFTCDGSNMPFRVMFKKPIEISANISYTASATLKGPDSHYGTKGVRKITADCIGGERITFHFAYAAGNNNGSSVEDGQIPEIIYYT